MNAYEWIKKNWMQVSAALTILGSGISWTVDRLMEGAKQEGYIEAKKETDEAYNEALRDAIIYRAKYESCCPTTGN